MSEFSFQTFTKEEVDKKQFKDAVDYMINRIMQLHKINRKFDLNDVLTITQEDVFFISYSENDKKSICNQAIIKLLKDGVIMSDGETEFGYIIKGDLTKFKVDIIYQKVRKIILECIAESKKETERFGSPYVFGKDIQDICIFNKEDPFIKLYKEINGSESNDIMIDEDAKRIFQHYAGQVFEDLEKEGIIEEANLRDAFKLTQLGEEIIQRLFKPKENKIDLDR